MNDAPGLNHLVECLGNIKNSPLSDSKLLEEMTPIIDLREMVTNAVLRLFTKNQNDILRPLYDKMRQVSPQIDELPSDPTMNRYIKKVLDNVNMVAEIMSYLRFRGRCRIMVINHNFLNAAFLAAANVNAIITQQILEHVRSLDIFKPARNLTINYWGVNEESVHKTNTLRGCKQVEHFMFSDFYHQMEYLPSSTQVIANAICITKNNSDTLQSIKTNQRNFTDLLPNLLHGESFPQLKTISINDWYSGFEYTQKPEQEYALVNTVDGRKVAQNTPALETLHISNRYKSCNKAPMVMAILQHSKSLKECAFSVVGDEFGQCAIDIKITKPIQLLDTLSVDFVLSPSVGSGNVVAQMLYTPMGWPSQVVARTIKLDIENGVTFINILKYMCKVGQKHKSAHDRLKYWEVNVVQNHISEENLAAMIQYFQQLMKYIKYTEICNNWNFSIDIDDIGEFMSLMAILVETVLAVRKRNTLFEFDCNFYLTFDDDTLTQDDVTFGWMYNLRKKVMISGMEDKQNFDDELTDRIGLHWKKQVSCMFEYQFKKFSIMSRL